MLTSKVTFLFFHFGKIPDYLVQAIEHARVFNPDAEVFLIADSLQETSLLDRFKVIKYDIKEFQSDRITRFSKAYRNISSYDERYEKFCFERWFVAEEIRKSAPEKTYVLVDSDVAIFGNVEPIVSSLPDCPVSLSGCSPHFSFIRGSIEGFLDYILEFYSNEQKIDEALNRHRENLNTDNAYNLTDNSFLPSFMQISRDVQNYSLESPQGFIDTNIHVPQGLDYLQLRRRPRKKVFWRVEEGRAIPYFKRGDQFVKAFILHFQGPGKRVFKRFNSLDGPPRPLQIWWWNQIFQRRWLANLM
jgi:hypothetical protein